MVKELTTEYGLSVLLTDDLSIVSGLDRPFVGDYDRKVAEAQKANCGYYIIDKDNHMIIDNEEDLSEIYHQIKNSNL